VRNTELRTFLTGAMKFGSKLQFYRIGFCQDMGFFSCYASPDVKDHIVTHSQVYNAAAKMARATDSGFLPAFVICRGYPNANRRLSNVANKTMQYVRDLLQYCSNYVTKSQTTRIEEVLTFDRLRMKESIAAALNEYRVFDKTELSITTKQLCRDVLYHLCNWRRHFNATCVGEDLQVL